jgi:uncharacterized protein (TIGR02001 family)
VCPAPAPKLPRTVLTASLARELQGWFMQNPSAIADQCSSNPTGEIIMNKLLTIAGLATLATTFSPVSMAADEKKPDADYTFTSNVALASEYRYRGISQTNFKPAVQGGFDFAHKSGFYLGTWASNISWIGDQNLGASGSMEWDWYGGYKAAFDDFGLDVGGLYYYYPGKYPSTWSAVYSKPDTFELYVAGSWKWISLKYSYGVTDIFGNKDSKGSGYTDLTANYDLGDGWGIVGHVGYQYIPGTTGRASSDASYTDWKLGVTKDFGIVAVGLSYIDTNAKNSFYTNMYNSDLGKGTALLTFSKTF